MAENRDPAIKLFGKTIPLPSDGEAPAVSGEDGGREEDKVSPDEEATPESNDKAHESPNLEEKSEPANLSTASESEQGSLSCQEAATDKESESEERRNETSNSLEKTVKKPDKILPCPRCNSMDTKFCYYNNYNVNQPRHFCKNCQRYWTAGGTMRNVPVGSGRRKNKNVASLHRHITVSDTAFQAANPQVAGAIHHPPLKPNGTVLSFGSDAPLCESMASVLSLDEKTMKNCNPNLFHRPEEQMVPMPAVENNGDNSSACSVTASNSTTEDGSAGNQHEPVQNFHGLQAQIPYINGSPWPYPWSPVPAFCPSSIPMSFYPATAYWGCTVPGAWGVPWISPLATPTNNGSSGSGPNSPTLGKHTREGDVLDHTKLDKGDNFKPNNQERNLWIPKTLRIDDPEEAAKSSIWTAIGLKNDMADGVSSCRLFKALQSKADNNNHTLENSQVLHANPAALSRSLNFQESS